MKKNSLRRQIEAAHQPRALIAKLYMERAKILTDEKILDECEDHIRRHVKEPYLVQHTVAMEVYAKYLVDRGVITDEQLQALYDQEKALLRKEDFSW